MSFPKSDNLIANRLLAKAKVLGFYDSSDCYIDYIYYPNYPLVRVELYDDLNISEKKSIDLYKKWIFDKQVASSDEEYRWKVGNDKKQYIEKLSSLRGDPFLFCKFYQCSEECRYAETSVVIFDYLILLIEDYLKITKKPTTQEEIDIVINKIIERGGIHRHRARFIDIEEDHDTVDTIYRKQCIAYWLTKRGCCVEVIQKDHEMYDSLRCVYDSLLPFCLKQEYDELIFEKYCINTGFLKKNENSQRKHSLNEVINFIGDGFICDIPKQLVDMAIENNP